MNAPNTIDPSGARAIPQVAMETGLLVELFAAEKQGAVVSYKTMADLIGRPVTPGTRGYGYLQSAKRILLRDHEVVLDAEPKVGVRVCTDAEKLTVAGRDVKKASRAVKRSGQKLRAVEYAALTDDQKREWNARMSLTGALSLLAAPATYKQVEKVVTDHALPSARVLDLFKA